MPGPAGFRGAPDTFAGKNTGIQGYHVSQDTPADQQALVWVASRNEWVPQAQAAGGLAGMTAGQVPVAATASTVTSSLPLSGASGATEVASATSAAKTSGHLATWDANGNLIDGGAVPAAPTGANPTAVVGSVAVNGSAATFMRSDAAPALGTVSSIVLSEIAAPTAPSSGAILYVDSTSHLLSYVDSQGNRAVIT
jgi:hypothetical protein